MDSVNSAQSHTDACSSVEHALYQIGMVITWRFGIGCLIWRAALQPCFGTRNPYWGQLQVFMLMVWLSGVDR